MLNVFNTNRKGYTHFLRDGGAGVGEHVSVDAYGLHSRNLGLCEYGCEFHIGVLGNEPSTATDVTCQRVVVQRAIDARNLRHHLKKRKMILVVVKIDFDCFGHYAVEET